MKKNLILLIFMLVFSALATSELNAQTDGFFANVSGQRENTGLMSGISSNGVGQFLNDGEGLSFNDFTGKDDAPVGNGMFLMATSGLFYLITKRRKDSK